ncbi:hypothetical protein F4604DRAFT_1908003 [Suillus subluteus]|nr:hypothetical protein F4604DRAFT_1908003 [Suillus subluteus]
MTGKKPITKTKLFLLWRQASRMAVSDGGDEIEDGHYRHHLPNPSGRNQHKDCLRSDVSASAPVKIGHGHFHGGRRISCLILQESDMQGLCSSTVLVFIQLVQANVTLSTTPQPQNSWANTNFPRQTMFWMMFSVNDSELRDIVTTLLGKRQPKTTKLRHRGFESGFRLRVDRKYGWISHEVLQRHVTLAGHRRRPVLDGEAGVNERRWFLLACFVLYAMLKCIDISVYLRRSK